MALSPEEMDAAVLANLHARTGRSTEDWLDLIAAAGPFAKPGEAVAWLKTQYQLGHVTAQILVRHFNKRAAPRVAAVTTQEVLGQAGAARLDQLLDRLGQDVPNLQVFVRQTYVGIGTSSQFGVAVRPKSGPALLWLALVAQDRSQSPLPTAPKLGGSDRFTLLLAVSEDDDLARIVAHLRAAALAGR